MKKTILASMLLATLFTTGCSQRFLDLTVASTKNVDLNNGQFIKGERVEGEDGKPVFIIPLGIPTIKEATDKAIETNPCAVGLTDVTADQEFFAFLVGFIKFRVEGNLLIDISKPGCTR